MNSIFKRRSIRKYQDIPVEKEKVEKLLRAAMQAPSAANQKPWEFIVVQDKEKIKELSNVHQKATFVGGASLAIVLLANEDRMQFPGNWQQDMGAAAQNILLEAAELGLGACWVGVAPKEERISFIEEMFALDDNLKPYCVISIGYPDGEENKFIDRYDETRVHWF